MARKRKIKDFSAWIFIALLLVTACSRQAPSFAPVEVPTGDIPNDLGAPGQALSVVGTPTPTPTPVPTTLPHSTTNKPQRSTSMLLSPGG